jgi:hypothetical protein
VELQPQVRVRGLSKRADGPHSGKDLGQVINRRPVFAAHVGGTRPSRHHVAADQGVHGRAADTRSLDESFIVTPAMEQTCNVRRSSLTMHPVVSMQSPFSVDAIATIGGSGSGGST